jgi:3-deoxy-7-phosphoheptulonate synthase
MKVIEAAGLSTRLMIDASHGNSGKRYENQPLVIECIARQLEAGDVHIAGVMIQSHLVAGRQELLAGVPLAYGQSITDAGLGWEESIIAGAPRNCC